MKRIRSDGPSRTDHDAPEARSSFLNETRAVEGAGASGSKGEGERCNRSVRGGDRHSSQSATPSITAYRDGPFLLRGPIVLIDEDGQEIEVRRRIIPLCRCGKSRMKPLCDGTHQAMRAEAQAGADASLASTTLPAAVDRRDIERPP